MTKKRLLRSRTDSKVAGVCGGIADYLGVDSTLVRILWLVFGIFVGYGLLLYIVLAMVVPKEPLVRPYDEPKKEPVDSEPTIEPEPEETVEEDDEFNYDNYNRSDDYDETSFYEREEEEEEEKTYRYNEFDERPKRNINATYLGLAVILIGVYFGIKVFIPALSMKLIIPVVLIGAGVLLLSRNKDGEA